MVKRLRADSFFSSIRDFYCLTCHLMKIHSLTLHCHEFYELEIITAGTSIDTIDGINYTLKRGDFIFLKPDNSHCLRAQDSNGAELINLAVSTDLMNEILSFLDVESEDTLTWPITGHLPLEMISQLTDQANQLVIPSKKTTNDRATFKQWMIVCFLCSTCFQKPDDNKHFPDWLHQLTSIMKTPEGLTGGIPYLKAHIRYSYPHVCRYFQKYLNQTPVEWLNEQRLIYSTNLLLYTELSILEISMECGFHTLSHYNHLFKAFYGVSPSTLRKMF